MWKKVLRIIWQSYKFIKRFAKLFQSNSITVTKYQTFITSSKHPQKSLRFKKKRFTNKRNKKNRTRNGHASKIEEENEEKPPPGRAYELSRNFDMHLVANARMVNRARARSLRGFPLGTRHIFLVTRSKFTRRHIASTCTTWMYVTVEIMAGEGPERCVERMDWLVDRPLASLTTVNGQWPEIAFVAEIFDSRVATTHRCGCGLFLSSLVHTSL